MEKKTEPDCRSRRLCQLCRMLAIYPALRACGYCMQVSTLDTCGASVHTLSTNAAVSRTFAGAGRLDFVRQYDITWQMGKGRLVTIMLNSVHRAGTPTCFPSFHIFVRCSHWQTPSLAWDPSLSVLYHTQFGATVGIATTRKGLLPGCPDTGCQC